MSRFPLTQSALVPVLAWMKEMALPFWGSVGIDDARGGFHERLDLDGRPVLSVPKRLMVQGRQLYVYSHAALLGWYPRAKQLAACGADHMISRYYEADGKPGWVYALAPDGAVDGTRDTYGHAFALLGLAWYHRLSKDAQIRAIIDATLTFVDDRLGAKNGGYLDAVPPPDNIRRQNPHMHLFETCLALYEALENPQYLTRAGAIFDLFAQRFFQPANGTLCEYFDAELRPAPGQEGRIVEPGHHYEWVWLLRQFKKLSDRPVEPYARALYDHADHYGWDKKGFIVDQLDPSGAIVTTSRRTWPHTECVKANVVEGEAGREGCDARAAQALVRLREAFIARPVVGGWMDRIGHDGTPIANFIPTSTLYHLFGAATEAVRATSALEPKSLPAGGEPTERAP